MISIKTKGFISGIIAAIGAWIIIMAARQELLETFPAVNQYILGVVIIIFAWYLSKNS